MLNYSHTPHCGVFHFNMGKIPKYFSAFTIGLKVGLTYRAEMLLWSIIDGMPLIYMLLLWHHAIPAGSSISGFTQNTIITYYLIGFIIRQLTGSHFEDFIIDEIQKGTFSTFLLKPISIKLFFFYNEMAWRVMTLFTSVLPIILAIFLINSSFLPQLDFIRSLGLLALMFLAYSLETIFSLLVASMGFIFENAKSFMHLRWISNMLFSGILIPFEFMPPFLRSISLFLPFRFRQYVPVQLFIRQNIGPYVLIQLLYAALWLVVLVVFLKFVWSKSIKKFTAVGQ